MIRVAERFPVVPSRDVLAVEGVDAAKYLQGQLSQDIEALVPGDSAWSLLLQPQGKVDAWLRVHRESDERFLLDVDAGFGDAVAARLSRFLIRTKATVNVVERSVQLNLVTSEADRIRAGVPAMGAELNELTIPAEVGQWLIDVSVSFTKGCYTGQELVARVDSRGSNTPRHLRTVRVDGGIIPPGTELVAEDGKTVGEVTSSADGLALAFIKRGVEPPLAVMARWDGGESQVTL